MPKPRLAIVVSHPIQHFCPQYASWAARGDIELRVFFGSPAGASSYSDKNYGIDIQWHGLDLGRFPHEFLLKAPSTIASDLDAPDLDARLREFAPNAVLLYGYDQRLSRRALRVARKIGAKILFFSDGELRHHRPLHVRVAKRIVLPFYLKDADVFLTTGDANEQYYRHYGVPAEKMVRAPYPIDRDRYQRALGSRDADRRWIRQQLDVRDDATLCVMVGKLVSWKRQRDLVSMLAEPGLEKVIVALIGTGRDEAELRAAAARIGGDRVRFAGFVQPTDLTRYYSASDVYVHASEREPHSVAVSEAVFMGCPIVISDRCGSYGPTDDVQAGRNGFVYRCGAVEQLADRVRRLAGNDALRTRFAAQSRAIGAHAQALSHGDGLISAFANVGLI